MNNARNARINRRMQKFEWMLKDLHSHIDKKQKQEKKKKKETYINRKLRELNSLGGLLRS